METIVFEVKGSMYRPKRVIKMIADNLDNGSILTLDPDLKNKYDENAVKVIYDDTFIGYVERDLSSEVKKIIERDINYTCEVISCFPFFDTDITDSGREIEIITDIDILAEIRSVVL